MANQYPKSTRAMNISEPNQARPLDDGRLSPAVTQRGTKLPGFYKTAPSGAVAVAEAGRCEQSRGLRVSSSEWAGVRGTRGRNTTKEDRGEEAGSTKISGLTSSKVKQYSKTWSSRSELNHNLFGRSKQVPSDRLEACTL